MRFDLLRTVLWLRWRLSRNQLLRAGRWAQALLLILVGCGVGGMAGALIGGYYLGRNSLAGVSPENLMLVIDGVVLAFSFFWVVGIVADVQRSESIDLQRLLHLPVTLRDVFRVNFVASHFTLSVLLGLPLVMGLSVGLALGRDRRLLLLLPLFLTYLFFISAWTYCLRGWLVQIMVNPRRRRTIVITLTMGVVLAGQLPNLFLNVVQRRASGGEPDAQEALRVRLEAVLEGVRKAHYVTPPLWVGLGTAQSAGGNGWPAAAAAVLFVGAGTAGLSRAYRSTLRFYLGVGPSRSVAPSRKVAAPRAGPAGKRRVLEARLPGVPDDVAAAAQAFWHSMMRAPEMKMAMLGPLLMLGLMAMLMFRRNPGEGIGLLRPIVAIGITVFALSGVLQVLFNQFGWDRSGFRALVLLPTSRRRILGAKNLAVGFLMLTLGWLIYLLISLYLGLSLIGLLAGLLQVGTAILILCGVGNYLSIVMPFRVNAGSLKPTRVPVSRVLVMTLCSLLLPVYMLPVLVGPGAGVLFEWSGSHLGPLVNFLGSLVMLMLTGAAYGASLGPLGRLLWSREQQILQTVTEEIE